MSDIEQIKKLRDLTGVGLTDAKQALVQYQDFDKALQAMQVKSLNKVAQRSERSAQAGIIYSYIHDNRIGVLIEVNCETDFVAKTDDFQNLVEDLALQIAASDPKALQVQDLPGDWQQELDSLRQQALADKVPEDKLEEIIERQLFKIQASQALLSQSFNKQPELTVEQLLKSVAAKLGENLVIARFTRFELGQSDHQLIINTSIYQ